MSSKPLTAVQESLLSHEPNFAVVLRGPHSGMCYSSGTNLSNVSIGEAEELRGEVKAILKKAQPKAKYYKRGTKSHR